MTYTFIIWIKVLGTKGTPPSLEEKKALPNCGNKDIHHVPHCCSQTESDHGWERDMEAVLAGVDEEDHDDAPLSHTTLKQERENVWDNLAIAGSAPNIFVPALHEHHYL